MLLLAIEEAVNFYLQGNSYSEKNLFKKAIACYLQALDIDSAYIEARIALANSYFKTEQLGNALKEYKIILKTFPTNYFYHFCIGYCYHQLGYLKEASDAYTNAFELNKKNPDISFNLGVINAELGNTLKAIDFYKITIKLKPDFIEAYDNLGVIYAANNDNYLAKQMFLSVLMINDTFASANYNLACLLYIEGKISEALEHFNSALAQGIETYDIYESIGDCYMDLQMHNKAIQIYKKAISINASAAEVHYKLGLAFTETGLYYEAISYFRNFLRLDETKQDVEEVTTIIESLESEL